MISIVSSMLSSSCWSMFEKRRTAFSSMTCDAEREFASDAGVESESESDALIDRASGIASVLSGTSSKISK